MRLNSALDAMMVLLKPIGVGDTKYKSCGLWEHCSVQKYCPMHLSIYWLGDKSTTYSIAPCSIKNVINVNSDEYYVSSVRLRMN